MIPEPIQRLLRSPDPRDQCRGLIAAAEGGVLEAGADAAALCASPDIAVRAAAAYTLGILGSADPTRSIAALERLLRDADALVRSDAVEALMRLGASGASRALLLALAEEPDATVRASLVEALGALKAVGSEPVLLALALSDEDEAVRGYAAAALADLGNPAVIPPLSLALETQPIRVKIELLLALARLGWPGAPPALVALIPSLRGEPLEVFTNAMLGFVDMGLPEVLRSPALSSAVDANPALRLGERRALSSLLGRGG